MDPDDQTASLMTPAKLAQVSARAPVSPSAFLDQMAHDVGHQHVRRLAELRQSLEAEARSSSAASVRPPLDLLAQALPGLDFAVLEPQGWWAGITGKSRSAAAVFQEAFERIDGIAQALASDVAETQKSQQPHAVSAERVLVECEVEFQALGKIIDQGARWLQTMRGQLKERQAQAGQDAQALLQVEEDQARCEILVGRLKVLRAAATASQLAHQDALTTAERRSALTSTTLKALASEVTAWRARVGALASAAAQGQSARRLDAAREAHQKLQGRLVAVLADCDQLGRHEAALLEALAAMGESLQSAA
jgi:hypothetical protein